MDNRVLAICALGVIARATSTCPETTYLVSGKRPIPDEYLSVSSEWHYPHYNPLRSHGPWRARLNTTSLIVTGTWVNGDWSGTWLSGAWSVLTNDDQQWIQARFLERSYITGIVTQGRNAGDPQRVTSYLFQFSENCVNFVTLTESNGENKIFPGNTDQDSQLTNMLPCPVRALCVRIQPVTWVDHISLRFDVLGCSCGSVLCSANCTNSYCDNCTNCGTNCLSEQKCSPYCAMSSNGDVCSNNGSCLNECVADHYGLKCELTCPTNCASVDNRTTCDDQGVCVNGCFRDFFGRHCNNPCPTHCAPGANGSMCDQQGVCVNGCAIDYFGTQCSNPCPSNCATGANGSRCDQKGVCVNGCANGHFGRQCSNLCPTNCAPVANGSRCDQNGVCVNGCENDHFGRQCSNKCPANCSPGAYGSRCDHQDVCVKGCANDHFGTQCSNPCPTNCAQGENGKKCDEQGVCVNGCANDHFGRHCSNPCPTNCAPVAVGSRCLDPGTCAMGYIAGYTGDQSESSTNRIVSEQSGSGYKYGMIASLIVVVVAIVTIAVMIFLLRKTRLTSKDVFNRSMSDRSGPSELNQYSMGTCSVYSTLDKQRNEDEPYASITVGLS